MLGKRGEWCRRGVVWGHRAPVRPEVSVRGRPGVWPHTTPPRRAQQGLKATFPRHSCWSRARPQAFHSLPAGSPAPRARSEGNQAASIPITCRGGSHINASLFPEELPALGGAETALRSLPVRGSCCERLWKWRGARHTLHPPLAVTPGGLNSLGPELLYSFNTYKYVQVPTILPWPPADCVQPEVRSLGTATAPCLLPTPPRAPEKRRPSGCPHGVRNGTDARPSVLDARKPPRALCPLPAGGTSLSWRASGSAHLAPDHSLPCGESGGRGTRPGGRRGFPSLRGWTLPCVHSLMRSVRICEASLCASHRTGLCPGWVSARGEGRVFVQGWMTNEG